MLKLKMRIIAAERIVQALHDKQTVPPNTAIFRRAIETLVSFKSAEIEAEALARKQWEGW